MQYFALQSNGELFALGDHGDFEAADQTSLDQHLEVVWIADSQTAQQWLAIIENNPD
ncbi:MAG: hypothetical protein ACO23H_18595 [Alphaproteobacteria bacterium]